MGSGPYSLWRGTRWFRRGLRRGVRVISFGLFAAGTIAAVAETINVIKNTGGRKKEDSGHADLPHELQDLMVDNERLECEVEALRQNKIGYEERTKKQTIIE